MNDNNYNYPQDTGGQPIRTIDSTNKYQIKQQLHQAVNSAHQILLSVKTVFPFTLFPDTVIIDREKLTVAHRVFFQVAEVISIRIEDILNVMADVGPFFGSIKISTRFFDSRRPYTVNYLWRGDALRIKRILQGHIIATQNKIDCSVLNTKELRIVLEDLGGAKGE